MLRNRIWYRLKPYVPRAWRMALRRWYSRRVLRRSGDIWPILPGSERPPEGWPGWPQGRQFAFVLTHDVEGPEGLAKVKRLAELEMSLGFRSSFNFIPEGPYRVPAELRSWLEERGFEVGVHDLHHDGHLFRDHETFRQNARKINHYLREWNAVGFRAGFMLRRLDWLHDLNILYDASTFDTDPFEPQPDHVGTIFPFFVEKPENLAGHVAMTNSGTLDGRTQPCAARTAAAAHAVLKAPVADCHGAGYVELPYTLPQDSTLFFLLREQSAALWLRKLDWVAAHGGMAMVNVHPDYVRFGGEPPRATTFPVEFYATLLRHVRERYDGRFWHELPRQLVASLLTGEDNAQRPLPLIIARRQQKPGIWIDLDNTPHVPFFEPIIEELRRRGYPVFVTARDAFQVCALADKKGLAYARVGRHYGKHVLLKAAGLAYRAMQLVPHALRQKPQLAVSHGARSQLLAANWLRIPSLLIEDYEYCRFPVGMRPTWLLAPAVIPDSALRTVARAVRKYPGIKEDVYAWKLQPDPALLKTLGLSQDEIIVTVRPPATEAHYHNPEAEALFVRFMDRACRTAGVRVVLLPRNRKQGDLILRQCPHWFRERRTVIPQEAVDGMNLIWHSDLVVSGGGTMNREAAALGVPVYSIFRGHTGAVDRHLCQTGRLVLVASPEEVEQKIQLVKRPQRSVAESTSRATLDAILDTITELAAAAAHGRAPAPLASHD
jgi:predicted glycosyltransferase